MLFLILFLCGFGCCGGENCESDDGDVMDAQELITELVRLDLIVDVENGEFGAELRVHGNGAGIVMQLAADFDFYAEQEGMSPVVYMDGIYLKQNHLAAIACDPFGWGSEYDWLCTMNGTKGRALGKAAGTPTVADIGTYMESGSEMYPGDITSTTYYNADTYVNALDTNANPAAFFGLTIAAFGSEWSPALEQWCTNDHIPMCIQE